MSNCITDAFSDILVSKYRHSSVVKRATLRTSAYSHSLLQRFGLSFSVRTTAGQQNRNSCLASLSRHQAVSVFGSTACPQDILTRGRSPGWPFTSVASGSSLVVNAIDGSSFLCCLFSVTGGGGIRCVIVLHILA